MPRPSFIDRIIGNLLAQACLSAWLLFTVHGYLKGDESQYALIFVSGFMVLWSWAAGRRVKDFRRVQAKWREAEAPLPAPQLAPLGDGSFPGAVAATPARISLPARMFRVVGTVLIWLGIIFGPPHIVLFVWGLLGPEVMPPILSVFPRWFLTYPDTVWQAVLNAYGWLTRPHLPTLPATFSPWLVAAPIGLVLLFLAYRLRRARRDTPARPRGAWKGTVEVVVPPPK